MLLFLPFITQFKFVLISEVKRHCKTHKPIYLEVKGYKKKIEKKKVVIGYLVIKIGQTHLGNMSIFYYT